MDNLRIFGAILVTCGIPLFFYCVYKAATCGKKQKSSKEYERPQELKCEKDISSSVTTNSFELNMHEIEPLVEPKTF